MKKFFAVLGLSTVLVACGSSTATGTKTSELAGATPVKTAIDLTSVVDDKVPVTINPGKFTQESVTYRLPRVIQGTYSVSDFGKYVDDFVALDYKGNALPVEKIDTNSWTISNAKDLDKITYNVNDTFDTETGGGIGGENPFSPAGTNIEPTNYVLNLHGFIGYFDSLKNNQYALDVTAPSNFKRNSALLDRGSVTSKDGKSVTTSYFADRYFDITDNPMFYGNVEVEEFMVGDIKIVLSLYSPNGLHKAAHIKETMQTMMQAQKTYLGDINTTPRYDIYVYLSEGKPESPKGFGALEHHTSTVVVMPEAMPVEALDKSLIDVVSHEFFHIVTPLSVHSEDVHYFDYNKPTFSKHLWMYEGVTEYFATLFQVDQGLVKDDEFYNKVLGKIKSASGMNDSMSFTTMSENVLEEPYASQYLNVYMKGALIGMCIDILMREESDGQRGILSLMKELSNKYGVHKPFNDDTIIEEITKMTYPSVGEFLQTHVVGNTPIDYSKFFNKVGLMMTEKQVETNYIQNDGALIVAPDMGKGTIAFNGLVANNSFWNKAGAKAGDVIKSIDGETVTMDKAQQIFTKVFMWQPGQDINVVLDRNGTDVEIKTTLEKTYTTGTGLAPNPEATPAQVKLREAWLRG